MAPVPKQIVSLVEHHQILLSKKARHQLDIGKIDTDDLTHSILYGKVVKKERDERKESKYKYTIIGPSHSGTSVYSCGKIIKLLKRTYFIITSHED